MNIINKNRQEKGVAGISLLIVVIVIISVIILAGFKWETDRAVTGTVGKVAQEQLEASVSIEGKYWKIDDSIYDKIKEELKAQGIDVFSLGFRNKDYLQKIVKAELVSNYPNLGEEVDPNDKNKFQGIVNFIRRDADGTTDGQIMQYMPEDEFNSYISAGDYESIKNMYTIDFSTNSTTGSTGADASGTYNGKNINYYADFAALSETPEELGLTVSKSYQNARTTTYGPEGFANGGYEGLTCVPGIDLVEGMKIAAMPMHKDAININDVQIGDWIYVENLGYFIVSDLGDKNGNFRNENWFDLFHIDGESGFVYQDYSNIKVIKQSEVENFVNSGYVKNSTQTSVTQNNTDMQKTITNTPEIKKSSMQIVVATKSEIDGVVSISKQKIDYKSQVSNYSVPMEFIVAHLQITNSVDYAIAIADMVINNSKIDLW